MAESPQQRGRKLAARLAAQAAAPPPQGNEFSDLLSGGGLPMEGRFNLLPIRESQPGGARSIFNKRELALPGVLAGMYNAFTAPGRAMRSEPGFNPEAEGVNMAFNLLGGGGAASRAALIPRGSLGMNAAPKPVLRLATGDVVDGLTIGKDIKNVGSISSSFNNWEELGLQTVKMSDFGHTAPNRLFYDPKDIRRAEELARQIKDSGRIDPLIVVEDAKGRYVLEGGHRLGALHLLGKKEFPALVVRDLDP